MKKTTAVGYVRVSTSEQTLKGISLANQEAKIRAYAELNDMELAEIVSDPGKSGKNLNRPGIQRVLDMVKDKKVEAIVCYKMDRISRKVIDNLALLEIFEKKGIGFHSITEKLDTSSAMGRFFINMTASLNQMERDLISERTKSALQLKKDNNQRAGNIPYGFHLDADGTTLIEDSNEQSTLNRIKSLKAQEYTLQAIADKLNEEGILTRNNTQWKKQYVHNLLRRAGNE